LQIAQTSKLRMARVCSFNHE